MHKLTVFLLTYNHVKHIRQCFEGILEQNTDFSYKIIVLDDASTDGTSDIVREYVGNHPGKIIPVIREKNVGLIENYYSALCDLDTDYFTLVEGDDYWYDPFKLQIQIDLLDQHKDCNICGHDSIKKDFVTGIEQRLYNYTSPDGSDIIIFTGRLMPKTHPSSRMYRHVYDFSKIKPKEGVVYDSCSFWFYCLQNPKFIFINKPMSVYNYTGEGMYSGAKERKRKWLALHSIIALNKALDYRYNTFNFWRFRKALDKKYRWPFILAYLIKKHRAYDQFLSLYAE